MIKTSSQSGHFRSSPLLLLLLLAACCWSPPTVLAQRQQAQRPNIIIMQPDDFEFLAEWTPPAHFNDENGPIHRLRGLVPNINRLRYQGLTMQRAYTTSPMCGTSRYSTMTGRYPSRSAFSRSQNSGSHDVISRVTIPTTKLLDVPTVGDGLDCSRNNLAALLRQHGYATGVTGKWHLGLGTLLDAPYAQQQATVRACGFDTAEAIYWENLFTADGSFLHNVEHVTDEAIQFIDRANNQQKNFFLYFNPTAPHTSGNVYSSLMEHTCLETPGGLLEREPSIPGMTEGRGCEAYRQSILDRAQGDTSNRVLGSIWVDDAVGALLTHLERIGELGNTIFLFQMDHGREGKGSLYEPGIRIAQFVHYPNHIAPGSSYNGLVSTIDIAPTIAAYVGIGATSPGWYPMDGRSWKHLVEQRVVYDRCLVTELDQDRAVVCRCSKSLEIGNLDVSRTSRRSENLGLAGDGYYELCDNGVYRTSPSTSSPEVASEFYANTAAMERVDALQTCHVQMTQPNVNPVYGRCRRQEGTPPPAAGRPSVFGVISSSFRSLNLMLNNLVTGKQPQP